MSTFLPFSEWEWGEQWHLMRWPNQCHLVRMTGFRRAISYQWVGSKPESVPWTTRCAHHVHRETVSLDESPEVSRRKNELIQSLYFECSPPWHFRWHHPDPCCVFQPIAQVLQRQVLRFCPKRMLSSGDLCPTNNTTQILRLRVVVVCCDRVVIVCCGCVLWLCLWLCACDYVFAVACVWLCLWLCVCDCFCGCVFVIVLVVVCLWLRVCDFVCSVFVVVCLWLRLWLCLWLCLRLCVCDCVCGCVFVIVLVVVCLWLRVCDCVCSVFVIVFVVACLWLCFVVCLWLCLWVACLWLCLWLCAVIVL